MNFTIRERITDLRREAALQARITASTQQQAAALKHVKRTDYKGAAAGIKEKGLNVIGGGAPLLGATAALAGALASCLVSVTKGMKIWSLCVCPSVPN